MKIKPVYILILVMIVWNVLLSLPDKKQENEINYELLQEIQKENERRFQKYELQVKTLQNEMVKDSIIVYSATRIERDSLRELFNPR